MESAYSATFFLLSLCLWDLSTSFLPRLQGLTYNALALMWYAKGGEKDRLHGSMAVTWGLSEIKAGSLLTDLQRHLFFAFQVRTEITMFCSSDESLAFQASQRFFFTSHSTVQFHAPRWFSAFINAVYHP